MMNVTTVTVFWSTLYHEAIRECGENQLHILNVYLAHIMPGASAVICFLITDVTLRSTHLVVLLVIGIVYGYINYIETKKRGTPLYWFLTWEDETSFFIYGGLMLFISVLWLALSATSLAMKPRPAAGNKKFGRSDSPTKRTKLE